MELNHIKLFESWKKPFQEAKLNLDLSNIKQIFQKGIKNKTLQYGECVNKSFGISVPRPKDWDEDINDTNIGELLSNLLDISVSFDSSVVDLGSWDEEEDEEQTVLSFDTDSKSNMQTVLKWIRNKS